MMKKIQATLANVIRILGMVQGAAAVEAFRTTEKSLSLSSFSWSTLTQSHPMLRATIKPRTATIVSKSSIRTTSDHPFSQASMTGSILLHQTNPESSPHHHDKYEEDRHLHDNAPSHKDHDDIMPTTVVSYLDWLSNETTSDQSMRLLSLRLASNNKQ